MSDSLAGVSLQNLYRLRIKLSRWSVTSVCRTHETDLERGIRENGWRGGRCSLRAH